MAGPSSVDSTDVIRGLKEKVEGLTKELERHRKSSEKYSRRLLWLTWALVALTLVLIMQGNGVF